MHKPFYICGSPFFLDEPCVLALGIKGLQSESAHLSLLSSRFAVTFKCKSGGKREVKHWRCVRGSGDFLYVKVLPSSLHDCVLCFSKLID